MFPPVSVTVTILLVLLQGFMPQNRSHLLYSIDHTNLLMKKNLLAIYLMHLFMYPRSLMIQRIRYGFMAHF